MNKQIEKLIGKGVKIPNPETIDIGKEVDINKISAKETTIYSGCKIYGKYTLIMQGARIGYEAPVTIENCQIGPEVKLNGGYFKKAVFLKRSSMGSGAHVREGTILEEQSNAAHTVGLKQTILFPFVTLGSLINFCDCLMSGGTSRKDHSEVGSSFIHFNYTPNQDKATPSLLGNISQGVMLNQKPIFLGGQGGLVGPCRLAFGTVTAAGTIWRKDSLKANQLLFGGSIKNGSIPYSIKYQNITRIVSNNIIYIANLIALKNWYQSIRFQFISDDFSLPLFNGSMKNIELAINERIKRLNNFCENLIANQSINDISNTQIKEIKNTWSNIEEKLNIFKTKQYQSVLLDQFNNIIINKIKQTGYDYISNIKNLNHQESEIGSRWLDTIIQGITDEIFNLLPSFKKV